MAAYLSPIGNELQADANGAPLVGGKIYSYLAGTTTPTATYTGSDGLTPQSNPIVLNSLGLPTNPIWLGAGVAVKLVIKDSNDVTIRTVDNVLGVNDPSSVTAQDQWVAFSGTPTYLSATSFSVAGDQTGTLQNGRRLKTANSGGTVYSTIFSSTFSSGVTTVVLINDSGSLDAGLSNVSYGILSAQNGSRPTSGPPYFGHCRLAKSGSNLVLSRFNGALLTINGINYTIPAAGVSLAPTALTPSTTYYIYAYMNAGAMTLEASTTTHATDSTTGMEVKSGDPTRTLVGMARVIGGPAWQDASAQRFVSSWFNRRPVKMASPFTANATQTSSAYIEMSASYRLEFLVWSGDTADLRFSGQSYGGGAGSYVVLSFGIDSASTAVDAYATMNSQPASTGTGPTIGYTADGLAEGYHFATLLANNASAGNSITCVGGATPGARSVISGTIQA